MGYAIHLIVAIIYNLHVLIVYLGMKLEKNFQDLVWLHFVEIGKMMELVRCVWNLIHWVVLGYVKIKDAAKIIVKH